MLKFRVAFLAGVLGALSFSGLAKAAPPSNGNPAFNGSGAVVIIESGVSPHAVPTRLIPTQIFQPAAFFAEQNALMERMLRDMQQLMTAPLLASWPETSIGSAPILFTVPRGTFQTATVSFSQGATPSCNAIITYSVPTNGGKPSLREEKTSHGCNVMIEGITPGARVQGQSGSRGVQEAVPAHTPWPKLVTPPTTEHWSIPPQDAQLIKADYRTVQRGHVAK